MGRRKTIQNEGLLEHARSVFLEKGAFGSTKEIADRAGISEATLFKRYPTKAKLFLAAMVPPVVDVDAIIHASGTETDPRRALTGIGRRMLAYFRTLIPTVLHLMTHPAISITDVSAHFQNAPPMALSHALADYLREAQSRGEIALDDPMATATLFISAIHSLPLFEMMEMHGGQNMDHAVDVFVEALWDGLSPIKNQPGRI